MNNVTNLGDKKSDLRAAADALYDAVVDPECARREDELLEVLDLLSTGRIEPDDPRLNQAYPVASDRDKTLRHWSYDDIQAAYDRLNGDHTAEPGDLSFYAEPAEVGRFIVGMGEVHGSGATRIAICGPLGEPGFGEDRKGALYLTGVEARRIGYWLVDVEIDDEGTGGDPA